MTTPSQTCPNCGNLREPSTIEHCSCGHHFADTTAQGTGHPTPTGVDVEALPPPEYAEDILPEVLSDRLRIEFKHFVLRAGQHGCIPFRLTNLSARPIRMVNLSFNSKVFKEPGPDSYEKATALRLNQGVETRDCDFFIQETPGYYKLDLQGTFVDCDEPLVAFRSSFTVCIRGPHEKVKITIADGGAADGENIDLEAVADITVRDGGAFAFSGQNSHSGRRTSEWLPLRIEKDEEVTAMLIRQFDNFDVCPDYKPPLPPDPPPPPPPVPIVGKRAVVSFPHAGHTKRVQIWTGRTCRIGKSHESSDLVVVQLPADDDHGQANDLISRRHCRVVVDGNQVTLTDDSKNGTYIDGKRLQKDIPESLRTGQVISLARNVMWLRYRDFRRLDESSEVFKLLSRCNTLSDCSTELAKVDLNRARQNAPLDAFRLRRLNNYGDRLEYVFIRRLATIGSSKYAAIVVDHPSVSEYHARLVLTAQGFQLEDLNSENGTALNGRKLHPRTMTPTGSDAVITLGHVILAFQVIGEA